MLAHLLRRLHQIQLLTGALLGAWVASQCWPHFWGVFFLALLGSVLFPLVLYGMVIGFLMHKSRPSGPDILRWHALWGEFVATLQIYGFQLPWAFNPPQVLPALTGSTGLTGLTGLTAARTPVLLVHGFVCNHRIWDKLSLALRRSGHPTLALDMEPLFTSIDDYVPIIEQAVIDLQRQTGAAKVVLIGHSMGGLAIRSWMRSKGCRRVAKVITLGTPHQGTLISSLAPTTNAAQMVWHSAWLQALQASETCETRALMHIAISLHDNIVYPQREQVLAGAELTVFEGLGHLRLCLDDHVIDWVLQQLDGRAFDHNGGL